MREKREGRWAAEAAAVAALSPLALSSVSSLAALLAAAAGGVVTGVDTDRPVLVLPRRRPACLCLSSLSLLPHLVTLVVGPAPAAPPAHRVQLVDEDDAGGGLPGGREQGPHAGGAPADVEL